MKHLVACLLASLSFWVCLPAGAQSAPQLDYFIGISCVLPARASLAVDVQIGVPVNVYGTSCGTTPITGAADLRFSSTDIGATLPPSQRFLPGARRLLGQVIFNSLGQQQLVVTDPANGITGVSFELPNVVVTLPSIVILIGLGCSQPDPFQLPRFEVGQSVTIIGYPCGTLPPTRPRITFASSDPLAQLPISPFASADPIGGIPFTGANGAFLGRARFFTPGVQSLTATDTTIGFRADIGFVVVASNASDAAPVPALGGAGSVALAALLLLSALALQQRCR
jgi:hypothetical protein